MEYATILVHLDGGRRVYQRLHLATQLARDFQATLIGLLAIGEAGPDSRRILRGSDHYVTAHQEWQRAVAQRAHHAFLGATDEELIPTQWKAPGDATAATVQAEAQLADLVILGQRDPSDDAACGERSFIESILLECGRPVLVVPHTGWFAGAGARVLVAWNGTREAVRATSEAMPLLRRAGRIDVLPFVRPGAQGNAAASPAMYAVEWLASHGVSSHSQSVAVDNEDDIGERMLSEAASREVDLIVMGAFGHGRIRESLLGGVTQTILTSMTVPVLMSH